MMARIYIALVVVSAIVLLTAGTVVIGVDTLLKISGMGLPMLVPLNVMIHGPPGTNVTEVGRPAMFGPTLPLVGGNSSGLSAPVAVVDGLACNRVDGSSDLMGKLAIVMRGGCEFYEKVLMLQARGAVGVIIGDNLKGRGLVTMFTQDAVDRARVPSFFVTRESYGALIKVESVSISVVTEVSSLADTLIFLLVSPLCSLSIIYGLLLFHRRYKLMKERAPRAVVDKFPTRVWAPRGVADAKAWVSGGECIICLEEYISGVSKVMRLPCGHEFHVDCITKWLLYRKKTCPICKQDVTKVTETTPLIKRFRSRWADLEGGRGDRLGPDAPDQVAEPDHQAPGRQSEPSELPDASLQSVRPENSERPTVTEPNLDLDPDPAAPLLEPVASHSSASSSETRPSTESD